MREGVDVNVVCGVAPCLQLLRDLLRVGRGEDTGDPGIFKRYREVVEKCRHSFRESDGCEYARTEEGVTA